MSEIRHKINELVQKAKDHIINISTINEVLEELDRICIQYIPSQDNNFKQRAGCRVNCFIEMFGVAVFDEFWQECKRPQSKYYNSGIQSNFIDHLIREKVLTLLDVPEEGCFVLYFNAEHRCEHGGILTHNNSEDAEKIVKSRWYMLDKVFQHKLMCIPTGFGDIPKYYASIKPLITLKYFMDWSRKSYP